MHFKTILKPSSVRWRDIGVYLLARGLMAAGSVQIRDSSSAVYLVTLILLATLDILRECGEDRARLLVSGCSM